MKVKSSSFLQNLCNIEYKHLQNTNTEVDIELFLPLPQKLISLKYHRDQTKSIFEMVQQEYDDEPVTFPIWLPIEIFVREKYFKILAETFSANILKCVNVSYISKVLIEVFERNVS